jgi:protein TonB
MPTHTLKSAYFYAPKDRSGAEFKSPTEPARLRLVNSTETGKIAPLLPETLRTEGRSRLRPWPYSQRREEIAAILLALALHLAWFAVEPTAEVGEPIAPPTPIQVNLIASRQPSLTKAMAKTEPRPSKKPVIKSKAKQVKPARIKQKKLLASSSPSAKDPAVENDEKPKRVSQAETAVARPVASSTPASEGPSVAKAKSSDQPLILPNLNADYLDNPAPAYPEEARARGEQGRVMVRALINIQGTVSQLLVQRSSGYASLDQAALATVKGWRFVPARRGENTVAAWVVVPISFSLEG